MMPKFITLQAVLAMQDEQIEEFGGKRGVRDPDMLDSALGQAQSTYAYTEDLHETAAQYCVSLTKDHAFIDGNKRIAADCMLTFLIINGFEPTMAPDTLFNKIMQVTVGEIKRPELAEFLRINTINYQ